jgi:hypothetical protein
VSRADLFLKKRGFGQTMRTDLWWLQPLAIFMGLSAFILYSTWAAFQGAHYYVEGTGYLSPMYSPVIFGDSAHSIFGPQPAWWPALIPFSPAFLILWAPAGFRMTCYYYRGSYYKAFWADPLNCTVGEPRKGYRGEQKFPLIMQNMHRYFFYLASLFILVLAHDAWKGLWFTDAAGVESFGIGVGTIVLTVNVILLGGYTFGCHSLRHLIGGRFNSMEGMEMRRKGYSCVSCLNRKHMVWAWCSLFWVGFSDIYVRLCSMGIWTDWRIL